MGKLLDTLKNNGVEITEDIEKKVMEEFVEKKDADLKDTEITNLKEQLKTRDKDIEELKKTDGTKLKEELTTLQDKYKTETEDLQKELSETQLNNAIKLELLKTNAVDVDVVETLLDKQSITLKDGKAIGFSEQIEKLQKDKGFLFKEADGKNESKYKYEPGGGKSQETKTDSKNDFVSIINENQAKRK